MNRILSKLLAVTVLAPCFTLLSSLPSGAQSWSADAVMGQTNFVNRGFNALDGNDLSSPQQSFVAGGKYFVCDTFNSRVLIWNSTPTNHAARADVVVGQTNFHIGDGGGVTSSTFFTPTASSDGTRLFVADPLRHRVLIWNSIPTSNGTGADVVVGQSDFTSSSSGTSQTKLKNPEYAFSDGTKLYILDNQNHRVLIYNSIPNSNGAAADVVVGQSDFVTGTFGTSSTKYKNPKYVSSNGTNMWVADYQNNRVLKYNSIPTSNGAAAAVVLGQTDFTTGTSGTSASKMNGPFSVVRDGGKLSVADSSNNRVLIWNSIPTTNNTPANVVVGQTSFFTKTSGASSTKMSTPYEAFIGGGKLFVADRSNHRALIYNSIPTSDGAAADTVQGHDNFSNNTQNDVDEFGMYLTGQGGVLVTGGKLIVSDNSNRRILIWNTLPTDIATPPDVVLGQPDFQSNNITFTASSVVGPAGLYSDGTKLFVADDWFDRILIWNTIPTTNNTPANVVVGQINFSNSSHATAQNRLAQPNDVAIANGKLVVADSGNHRIMIWNTIPTANGANADLVIGQTDFTTKTTGLSSTKFNDPTGLDSDGTKLVVTDSANNRALVYNTIPTTNGAPADVVFGQPTFTSNVAWPYDATRLRSPEYVRISTSGMVYVADKSNNRVFIYNSIPTTNGPSADAVIGQTNLNEYSSGVSATKIYQPVAVYPSTNRVFVVDAWNNRVLGGNLPNLAPVLNPIGDKIAGENQLLTFTISATDPDSGPSALTYSASNLPFGATFDSGTRTFSWTPTPAQIGAYANVHFEVSDGAATDSEDIVITVVDERYGFETGVEGWIHSTYEFGAACTSVEQSSTQATAGTYALKMNMNLIGGSSTNSFGESSVDMRAIPPSGTVIPVDLQSKTVTAYVYCPTGAKGDPSSPNGIQIFVKDQEFDSQYGSWNNVVENTWMKITMTVNSSGSFDATKVIMVGVKMGAGGSSTDTYTGPIYVDAYSFPIPAVQPTDHAYTFEAGSQDFFPRWGLDPGFGATAWTNAVLSSGTLAMDSDFTTSGSSQKGFIGITYQPDLYLTNKDHHVIRVELKFDPPAAPYQFVGQIWVYDHGSQKWFVSDDKNVGAGVGWNVMEFDLDDNTAYNPDLGSGETMPMNQILTIGVQLFANSAYEGTIHLDNVSFGGEEIASNYVQLNTYVVGRSGTNFVVNGTNWYFAGANAEYLIKRPMPVVQQVLDSATNMHLRLVRTWAFDEGKPWSVQPERGKWNEAALEHLDRIIAEAGKRGIRLLLGLVDNWGHNGGMYKYMDWVAGEYPSEMTGLTPNTIPYHDEFFTNAHAKQWYKDYVNMLLTRTNTVTGIIYKNDATVMGWEIVNEPRNETNPGGDEIHDWIKEMSDYARSLDTNHLLAAGVEGTYITTFSNANTRAYQTFPNNYWQYGLKEDTNTVSANADFISNASSTNIVVSWQEGTYDNPGTINSETRDGIPNVDFLTCRLYVDQREYNLWRDNNNGYDQRLEWMNEHLSDAHNVVGKPVILEEFGVHADIGWTYNGSFAEFRFHRSPEYTQTQRAAIFETFYDHAESIGMNGTLFWNLGYEGVFLDPFNMAESTTDWSADTSGSDATGLSLNTNETYIIEGDGSLKMDYDGSKNYEKAWFSLDNQSEKWIRRMVDNMPDGENRVKFVWNIYNPGSAIQCAVAVSTTSSLTWHEAEQQTISTGWNEVIFDLSSGKWKSAATSWQYNGDIADLHDVQRVSLGLFNYTGTGSVYVDDLTIWFDDGFIIYPSDEVISVIRNHSDNMNAK